VGVEANWHEGDDAANVAWARGAVESLQPFSGGAAYLNFPGLYEEGETLLRDSHGDENYERLIAIRGVYDPDGLFTRPGLAASTLSRVAPA
jgi:FAD/FMN-containing dehydrogenase